MRSQPIGVMDSGLGGLSVWQALVERMPDEDYCYVGDSVFCPYGSRPPDQILARAGKVVDFLVQQGCKIIVVACNAITAAAIDFLRDTYPIAFIGMEPAIKPAAHSTRSGAIGVLATERTLAGRLFQDTRSKYTRAITVVTAAGHGLVECVEALDFEGEQTMALLTRYLRPMMAEHIDHLVLGCTHYPFLQRSIKAIVGDGVTIVNPAPAVARRTETVLEQRKIRQHASWQVGESIFYTTGDTAIMQHMLSILEADRYAVKAVVM